MTRRARSAHAGQGVEAPRNAFQRRSPTSPARKHLRASSEEPAGEHAFGAAHPPVLLSGAFTINGVTIPVPEIPVLNAAFRSSSSTGSARRSSTVGGPPGWIDLVADAGRPVIPVDILGHGGAGSPHDPEAYADLEASVARRATRHAGRRDRLLARRATAPAARRRRSEPFPPARRHRRRCERVSHRRRDRARGRVRERREQ